MGQNEPSIDGSLLKPEADAILQSATQPGSNGMSVIWRVLIVMTLASSALAQDESPWVRKRWDDKYCGGLSGFEKKLCRNEKYQEFLGQLNELTPEGQLWISKSCPMGEGWNNCRHAQLEAMLRPGWPDLDELRSDQRDRVDAECPKALNPSEWRTCVERLAEGSSRSASVTTMGTKAADYAAKRSEIPSEPVTGILTPEQLHRVVSPSVYLVIAGNSRNDLVIGSAVAVSRAQALTNCHIIRGKSLFALIKADTKDIIPTTIGFADEASDRCFLVAAKPLAPIARVRNAENLQIGERVYTIGNPSGLTNTLGEGIVSGLREYEGMLYIQTSAPISPGSSGGALVDKYGALVGITTFRLKDGQGLNFAISAEQYWR